MDKRQGGVGATGAATAGKPPGAAPGPRRSYAWLPEQMPGVARLVAEKRRLLGDAHVNECWRRGVVELEPGWFFAREGALAVGTPWDGDPVLANFAALQVSAAQALLVLAEPVKGGERGAH